MHTRDTPHVTPTSRRRALLPVAAAAAALLILVPPAGASVVLLSASPGAPAPQDANLVDWQGRWVSALDRAAPAPGQLPPWQVNIALYGDYTTPYGTNVIEPDATCRIVLQVAGAPPAYTTFSPCVEGPRATTLGQTNSPTPEQLDPELSEAPNGAHNVTITTYDGSGTALSTVSFNVEVDNVLPSAPSIVGAVGWQTGGEVITSTATTSGPSGIAGQWCSIGTTTPAWYAGSTAQLAVQGNGSIPVQCTAQNNAGVPGGTSQFNAMLDNSPPTGAFLDRNPNQPTVITTEVADALSGVAGGQIQIQTTGGWQNLPTSYNAGTGRLTAQIPDDGSLPDGNYQLRALVTNAVGTTATITTDQNGAPAVITEPLRIVTRLPVGATQALIRRCRLSRVPVRSLARKHQRPPARLAKRCTQVPVPTHTRPVVLGYGRDGTVSGLLQTVDGNPIAGETVDVSQQAPGWAPHRQRAVTTGADGRFTYTLTPGPSRTLTFAFPGNATLRPSSASTIIQVAGSARIQLEHQALAGHTLRITGQVLGGYIPTGGVLVQLQYRVRGVPVGWAPFHRAIHTDSHGRFALQFPLSRAARGYTYMFNAVIEQQNGWPYLTTTTNAVARNVR